MTGVQTCALPICLNIIDIVFSDDENVRNAWKDLYDKYCVQNPDETQLKKIQNAQYKLLDTMANSLGYKDKVTWETIQNPYIPEGKMCIRDRFNGGTHFNSALVHKFKQFGNKICKAYISAYLVFTFTYLFCQFSIRTPF